MRKGIRRALRVIWSLPLGLASLGCGGSSSPDREEPPLRERASFPVGVGVDSVSRLSEGGPFRDIVLHHFDRITPGNDLKMDAVHPAQDRYAWDNADFFVDFAAGHDQALFGHVLVWHLQMPAWAQGFAGTPAAWETLVREHIRTVMTRYAGVIDGWDVVNEAFLDDGSLRPTPFREHLGEDYIARCFQWARAAAPSAELFYNDYALTFFDEKLAAVLAMIDDFQGRDPPVPIDGIGFQMHLYHDFPPRERIQAAVDAVVLRGLRVHFSELDVSLNLDESLTEVTDARLELQRQRYRDVVSVYRTIPASQQAGITVWGVSDADSWIRYFMDRMDWPLLFDDAYEPKPAFYGFLEALGE